MLAPDTPICPAPLPSCRIASTSSAGTPPAVMLTVRLPPFQPLEPMGGGSSAVAVVP